MEEVERMINSRVGSVEEEKQEISYPYIGKYVREQKGGDEITYILFIKPKTGIVLLNSIKNDCVGYYSGCWDESKYKPTTDPITLKMAS